MLKYMELAKGASLDSDFEIEETVASGSFGVVYKARQSGLARSVALKVLNFETCADPDVRERFFREAKALSQLSHRNIVKFYKYGVFANTYPYLSMEYLDGQTLQETLRKGVLPSAEILSLAEQITSALAHAHECGVIHRDVKPSNVIICPDGTAKLVDLGLVKLFGGPNANMTKLTMTGFMVGTASYMSPEQYLGEQVGPSSDIYSLGCLLFECMTGSPPYVADTAMGVLFKHAYADLPDDTTFGDYASPPELRNAVIRALAKSPDDRFIDMHEFNEVVKNCIVQAASAQTSCIDQPKAKQLLPANSIRDHKRYHSLNWVYALGLVLLVALFSYGVSSFWTKPPKHSLSTQTSPSKPSRVAPEDSYPFPLEVTACRDYILQNRWSEAEAALDRYEHAQKLNPNIKHHGFTHFLRAQICVHNEQDERAKREFSAALADFSAVRASDEEQSAALGLASCYNKTREFSSALSLADTYLPNVKFNRNKYANLLVVKARALAGLRKFDQAEVVCRELILIHQAEHRNSAELESDYFMLAEYLAAQGKTGLARNCYQELLLLDGLVGVSTTVEMAGKAKRLLNRLPQ
jgi:serine/threonine protein kinase